MVEGGGMEIESPSPNDSAHSIPVRSLPRICGRPWLHLYRALGLRNLPLKRRARR